MAGLVVKPRARLFHGHDWVYASEVTKVFGEPDDGDVVSLKDGRDRLLGSAIFNSRSQIVARRFSRQRQELDRDFFHRRIQQALDYRERRGLNLELCRLIWSESDGLPGLIVDRYGDCLVLQTLTLAMDQRKALIIEVLRELTHAAVVIERNDAPVRRAEGLELVRGVLFGPPEDGPVLREIEVSGSRFRLDLLAGQKTGFYLDQVDNYREVAAWARGRRVLDCFANQGAFSLACARAGAAQATAVEMSGDCLALLRQNAERNGLTVLAIEANVFDFLKDQEQHRAEYDLIILDPPSFTKSREKLHDALRGYKEIHLRALKLLSPAGLLATFCCSHHVSDALFKEAITDASVDAKRSVRQLRRFSQSSDHPILPHLPETEYLKGYLFEAAPGR